MSVTDRLIGASPNGVAVETSTPQVTIAHPSNIAACCDGSGQVFHNASGDVNGPGALVFVKLCPDAACKARRDAEFFDMRDEPVRLDDALSDGWSDD